jgi:hypothetical protein
MKRFFFFFISVFFASPAFSQVLIADIGKALSEFADDNGSRLPLSSDLGLNWSDAYVGQLMDLPPHFGFGISFGFNTMKTDKLNALGVLLGTGDVTPWISSKHLLPGYVVETRIGGFQNAAFDLGFKAGYFPDLFPLFGGYSYESFIMGGDIRVNINRGYGSSPKISLGLGVNYLSGHFKKDAYATSWNVGGTPLNPGGGELRITWSVYTFLLKFFLSKQVLDGSMTIFTGVNAGYAITNTGIAIVGDKITFGGAPVKDNPTAASAAAAGLKAAGNNSTWEVKDDSGKFGVWGNIGGGAIAFYPHGGVAVDFRNDLHLQLDLVIDLIHFEFGFSVGFRWQQ